MAIDDTVQGPGSPRDPDRLCAYLIREDKSYGEKHANISFIHIDRASPEGRAEAERRHYNLDRYLGADEYEITRVELEDMPFEAAGVPEGIRAYVFHHENEAHYQEHEVVLAETIAEAACLLYQQDFMNLIVRIEEKPLDKGVLTALREDWD